ncbi:hypothetical protein O6H91_15G045800 [Diphasiastrum complanatum]|uniref:Uncharacterized protein n=3 Tax=Diphasiastrum complanatum TaxID=34168 RepID=A0ACC2BHV5_DIPCM|nr:hypothetical protein O6H91_15G045800 [Diphasiastrum complanatum]KAJ7529353.1 hypothetical protein O6H91_15G045800 [Diphasiastrum complanatum]KAJ7529354.1 hypothetical protein O6H91_15G045800 [Diphasiastrum complanatum]
MMSKVRKWMMEERRDINEKIVMPEMAIKLFGKTIALPLYINPDIEVNTENPMNARSISLTDFKSSDAPEKESQYLSSPEEDERFPSLVPEEIRSSSSSNRGYKEDKQVESFSAADDPLTAAGVTDAKPQSKSGEGDDKAKSDEDPQSSVSEERARRKPDKAVSCPRCESLDTKFCYYNNYNLNQPRHFCKNCQRYWTAGGSLRNVPVGAGRRKNKHVSVQQWHVQLPNVRADAMEAAQRLISCAFPEGVDFPLTPVFTQDMRSLLSASPESMNQKASSAQAVATCNQASQKPSHVRSQKTDLKDGAGWGGWPGGSPVSPLHGTWPLLCNMRWIDSSLAASEVAISALPGSDADASNKRAGIQACPPAPRLSSGWSGAWNMSLGAAAAAAIAAAAAAAAAAAKVKSAELATTMPVLGKHPRSESTPYQDENAGSLWAPKTQRLTGPGEEAARSSIMAILAAAKQPESITSRSMLKAFQPKQGNQHDNHPANFLTANPAALARSAAFRETN